MSAATSNSLLGWRHEIRKVYNVNISLKKTWNGEVSQSTKNSMMCYGVSCVDGISVQQCQEFDSEACLDQL